MPQAGSRSNAYAAVPYAVPVDSTVPVIPSGDVLSGVCDRCLGRRLVGSQGELQQEVARDLRGERDVAATPEPECRVCEGAFADVDTWRELALEALAPYEFQTFQPGVTFPKPCELAEKALIQGFGGDNTETARTEANRLLAPRIAEATGAAPVTEGRPDVVVHVDTRFWTAAARANSLFVAGRYTKHRRDIPQTHWPCRRCQGGGCWECDDTGVRYAESVESGLADVMVPAFEAASASFHGAGREDVDALMLGDGRPFVLELHEPKRRSADLAGVEHAVNARREATGTGVQGLRITEKEEVARIKAATYGKEYLARCEAEADVAAADLERAAAVLAGQEIQQRTPERVAHRRADKVRTRRVHTLAVHDVQDARRFSLRVHAESGAYIKELVHGDGGRTTPNFSDVVGVPVRVAELDVMRILDEES